MTLRTASQVKTFSHLFAREQSLVESFFLILMCSPRAAVYAAAAAVDAINIFPH